MATLSVLIPVYNERYTVEQVLEEVLGAALPEGVEREIVVVDDASTDGTAEVLDTLASRNPTIKLLRHESNRGKGAAIRTGMTVIDGDFVVMQDADLEYSPSDYARLMKPLLENVADAVYGSRFLGGEYRRVLLFWHSIGNRLLTLFSNLFTNLNLTDMETCYKMVKASILKSIPLRSNRFGIEPELTAKLAKRRCRIYEVPISYRGRTYREGKKITWRDGVAALFTILKYWLIDDVYEEHYGHAILHSLSRAHRFNRWMAAKIKPFVGQDVLEIGAGMANISLELLPRLTYVASDIDPLHLDVLKALFARSRRVDVAKLDLEEHGDFAPFKSQFDTVVCLNVLEHIQDDHQGLCNVNEALRPGGRLCLLVPRAPGLYGSLDEVLGHYRRYTQAELRKRLAAAGFEIEEFFDFNRIGVIGWLINARVFRKKRFSRLQLKIYDSMVWLWRRIDPLIPWKGLSYIAIARKSALGDPDNARC